MGLLKRLFKSKRCKHKTAWIGDIKFVEDKGYKTSIESSSDTITQICILCTRAEAYKICSYSKEGYKKTTNHHIPWDTTKEVIATSIEHTVLPQLMIYKMETAEIKSQKPLIRHIGKPKEFPLIVYHKGFRIVAIPMGVWDGLEAAKKKQEYELNQERESDKFLYDTAVEAYKKVYP